MPFEVPLSTSLPGSPLTQSAQLTPPEHSQAAPRGRPGAVAMRSDIWLFHAFLYICTGCALPQALRHQPINQEESATCSTDRLPQMQLVDCETCTELHTRPIGWESWRNYPEMVQGKPSEEWSHMNACESSCAIG